MKFLPTADEMEKKFNDLATPMDRKIENLSQKNECLRKARDLLLPKLINGEVDIETIETNLEEENHDQQKK